jgi:hypothetical protein
MGYALRRTRLRGGNFAVESVATLPWNDRQLCNGISGNFGAESMATLPWNQWQLWCGIDGNFRAEYATMVIVWLILVIFRYYSGTI